MLLRKYEAQGRPDASRVRYARSEQLMISYLFIAKWPVFGRLVLAMPLANGSIVFKMFGLVGKCTLQATVWYLSFAF